MIDFLSVNKKVVLLVLVMAAVLNSFKLYGDWGSFFGVMAVQLWFARGVYAFLAGGVIHIAPSRVLPDADPELIRFMGFFILLLYVFVFFW